MNRIQVLILVVVVYFAGLMTGSVMQTVDAEVKAPNEYNQPMTSQQGAVPAQPEQVQPQPLHQRPPERVVEQPVVKGNGVPEVRDETGAVMARPVSEAAAIDQGATLYSVSSSMMSDIQRLEDDVALLKNKVNILMNMR